MDLTINRAQNEGATVLTVSGEADVSCADVLRTALDEALAGAPSSLTVDIANLSYIDSTGIGALVASAHRAQEAKVAFAVVNPQRNVARVLGLLGVDKELGLA